MKGHLVVVKVYEGEYDEFTAKDVKEVDMFSVWTQKKPNLENLKGALS